MSFKVYTVHDWFDVERLCPDDVKHYKTKELLVDYDSYAKLEAERDALKYELEEERQENASLRSGDDYERGAE